MCRARRSRARGWAFITTREKDWDLYELAEGLIDLDHRFQLWRFQHMKTVERIIGYKPGTGGTGGVSYLAKALELRFFPELWQAQDFALMRQRSASAISTAKIPT